MGKEMEEKNKYQEALEEIINGYQYAYNYYCQFQGVSEEKAKELFEHFNNKNIGLLKRLLSKETPEEPIKEPMIKEFETEILQYKCPTCKICKVGKITDNGWETKGEGFTNYCPICGQKIKW